MEEEPVYKVGAASIFHSVAVQVPPIVCDKCGTQTAEFKEDYDKYEIYQCTCCNAQRWIAVR